MSKKPIALFITDTHLFERGSKNDELISDNIELNKSLYRQAIQIAKENNLDTIFHGGDIFDSRKTQSLNILNSFIQIIKIFEANDIKLWAISGNHDKTDYSATESFLFPFKHYPNFNLVERSESLKLSNDILLHLIPFYEDEVYINVLKDHLSNRDYKEYKNVLLTHIGAVGAITNAGKVLDTGIDTKLFKSFDKVLSGHYHDRSELNNGKVVYIGAAYQHNFGEGENKGVALLFDDLSLEYIDLEFPKYKNIQLNIDDLSKKDISDIIETQKNSKDYIKLNFTGSKEKYISKKETINDLMENGIKVTYNDSIVLKESTESITTFSLESLLPHFEDFCKEKNHDFNKNKKYIEKCIVQKN